MCIVSKAKRAEYLRTRHPILFKLCIANNVPEILMYRCNTDLPFCYGRSEEASPIPVSWDTVQVQVIPLWEGGSRLTAIRLSSGTEEFVHIHFEDPNNVQVIAKTVNGLFTYVFYFLIESAGGRETEEFAEIEKLATYLDFKELDFVVELLPRFSGNTDYESFLAFTRSI